MADNEFLKQLQDNLLKQGSQVSSSEESNIDKLIGGAISGLETGREAEAVGIKAGFGRQREEAARTGERTFVGARESSRNIGAASQFAILSQIQESTDRSLKDLDAREREALASGSRETAAQIASLKVQQLQFRQQAQQDLFKNLLAGAQVEQGERGLKLQERQVSFSERQATANVGLQYGVTVGPNDTLETVVARAIPVASDMQKAQLAKLVAETKRANAEAAKALRGDEFTLDAITASAFASTFVNLTSSGRSAEATAFLANVLDKGGSKAFNLMQENIRTLTNAEFSEENLKSTFTTGLQSGSESVGSLRDQIEANVFATTEQKEKAIKILEEIEGQARVSRREKEFAGAATPVGGIVGAKVDAFWRWVYGVK